MSYLWPIALQILAFCVAMAEVALPSFGILAILCAALAIYSWQYIVTHLPHTAVLAFGVADLLLIPIGVKLAVTLLGKSPMSHRTDLGSGSGLESVDKALQRFVGREAKVDAPLRPTGKIKIDEEVFEAQAQGEWVERGTVVKVVSVSGSRFMVEKI